MAAPLWSDAFGKEAPGHRPGGGSPSPGRLAVSHGEAMADHDVELCAARARDGDQGALARALEALRPQLVRFVELRLDADLRRRLEPEDLVQETLLAVHRRFGEWRALAGYPFRVWVRLIAAQELAEARRRHVGAAKRSVQREEGQPDRSRTELGAVAERFAASQTSASEMAQRAELRARLEAALASLEELDREILTLRQLEGLSNEDAALELGIEPAAASKRFTRALGRLRPLLRGFETPALE
jgi:RNA polymerase sigma-70 factor, ECF subfamily